ncbi:hypothetical protein MJ391_27090 [Escherichia coli]|nr:hypothetical protein MJ391_27090 [Escherichia coli]
MDVVHACGIKPQSVTLIGGGARSEYWRPDAGGYQRSAARLPYRGRCRPGAGGGQAGAAGGSRRGRPPRAAEAAAA